MELLQIRELLFDMKLRRRENQKIYIRIPVRCSFQMDGRFLLISVYICQFQQRESFMLFTFLEERQDSMWEEPLNIQIPIESVHSLKKRKTDSVWKHGKDGTEYRITEVTENIWYMEVKYQWKSKNEDFFLFQFSDENDMTYADLGAVADKNGDGSYSGRIYYEIRKKDIEKMIFSPIRIKEKYDDEREIMDGESIIINGGEYDEK